MSRGAPTDPVLLRTGVEAAAALGLPPIAAAWISLHALLTTPPPSPPEQERAS